VRVDLHGRRVAGWIIALGNHGDDGFSEVSVDRLLPLQRHSGLGVISHLVPLALDVAADYLGPRRAVLQSASAPKMSYSVGRAHYGKVQVPDDVVTQAMGKVAEQHVVLRVPPLLSALSAVLHLVQQGPVLVVCPTVRMAVVGAASLRRRGCSVALVPDDWDVALSGVDVVIGARSAVWAPCPNLSAIVVIDEHDESLREERIPTWNAREVAYQRAKLENARCILTSPLPSVEAGVLARDETVDLIEVKSNEGWPQVVIADLTDVPVAGSLATSELLQRIRHSGHTVLCVLNTKGRARLLACRQCRAISRCPHCQSALSTTDGDELFCGVCNQKQEAICGECGRTSFLVLRAGISRLREQLSKSASAPVVEVDAKTSFDDLSDHNGIFIGTEALLHRVNRADVVVLLDFDTEMLAPRVTASRDAIALFIRAARVVGRNGVIVLQTRHVQHLLIRALETLTNDSSLLDEWEKQDLDTRKMLNLPPFSSLARVEGEMTSDISFANASVAQISDGSYLIRTQSKEDLRQLMTQLKESSVRVRVDMSPVRY